MKQSMEQVKSECDKMGKWEIENPIPDNELKLKIWKKERLRYANDEGRGGIIQSGRKKY